MPTFIFTSYILRCRTEREYAVEVTYSVTPGRPAQLYGDYPHPAEPDEIEIVTAFVDGDAELTDEDYDRFHDEACARSVEDMAEYHSEAAEYRAEQRRDAAA